MSYRLVDVDFDVPYEIIDFNKLHYITIKIYMSAKEKFDIYWASKIKLFNHKFYGSMHLDPLAPRRWIILHQNIHKTNNPSNF